ncbi:MAG: hypothetical protein KKA19_08865 [Candidatus Margulisbacteria bacterium]|nr:hypothetical protein [Candidatus Margulisiibacteriota bacterium]
MFRSFVLMLLLGFTSISKWVIQFKREEILAYLCGWEPGDIPGVGTFYDFQDRVQDGPYQKPCSHREKPSKIDKGRHIRNLKEEKIKPDDDPDKNEPVTMKLAKFLLSTADEPRPQDLHKMLEDILMELGVKPSAEKGLLGDLKKLDVVGDSSCLPSGSNSSGKSTCNCLKEKGTRKCDCPRSYTDRTSNWGWDPYHEVFYFGDRFYQHLFAGNKHDLPLHVSLGPASEVDYTLCPKDFDRMLKTFREHNFHVNITGAGYDKGVDAMGDYFYFMEKNIPVAIPLNKRRAKNLKDGNLNLSSNAIPLCKAGKEMRRHYFKKEQMSHVYCCPIKRGSRKNGEFRYVTHREECPLDTLCEPDATLAPTVQVCTKDNPRFYPVIPRGSKRYKKLAKERTGTERSNSFKKWAYSFDKAQLKSRAHRLIRLHLLAVIEHRKAMFKEETRGLSKDKIVQLALKNMEIN